ncbi:hypothetical protein FA15DRAFT_697504 [Coprinopsis marcescibilis]|uniref:Uncharacterized protein n=1 Tax=Coprinopsis marcescibilis TaxID=230819 RepID=A0A5C3KUC1_COPMA|nr:hypothetical protein FA15DRAFT_697504 [Coprinopsis marcescibilis]
MYARVLNLLILLISGWTLLAAPQGSDETVSTTEECVFSCPLVDIKQNELLRVPGSVSPASDWYSVFECIYAPKQQRTLSRKCIYDKKTGAQSTPSEGDNCPSSAFCESVGVEPDHPPSFSSQKKDGSELKYEVPAWIDFGRYLLWMKEHHE